MSIERIGRVWLLVPAVTIALVMPRLTVAQQRSPQSPTQTESSAQAGPPPQAAPPTAPQASQLPAAEAPPPQAPAAEAPAVEARAEEPDAGPDEPKEPRKADPPGLRRLAKDYNVWLDAKRKLVVADGKVCLRRGPLEMFACPRGTKEHESIVSVGCPAFMLHAGLLAVGAKPGSPVKFNPEYAPATGMVIDVWVLWKDSDGRNHKVRAQEWVKNEKTGKAMADDWVFAGSGFWRDDDTGMQHYHADGGDLICVSNFPTAMLDLPIESSQVNDALLFSAFTDRIPPIGTEVRLVLAPRIARKGEGSSDSSDSSENAAPPAVDPGKDGPATGDGGPAPRIAPAGAAPGDDPPKVDPIPPRNRR